jgi:hypothetical protein
VLDELPDPLGLVVLLEPEVLPDGDVVEVLPEPVAEPEPVVERPLPVVPGDADGVPEPLPPTRSVSAWLQAAVTPTSKARAKKPESIFFITLLLPCGGGVRPPPWGCNRHASGAG